MSRIILIFLNLLTYHINSLIIVIVDVIIFTYENEYAFIVAQYFAQQ